MKMTREQYNKINARMGNGWKLDLRTLVLRGEKAASLRVPLPDGSELEGRLYIHNFQTWRKDQYSGVEIVFNVSRWSPTGTPGVWGSHGLGWTTRTPRPDLARCLFSEVEKMTHNITARDVLAVYEDHAGRINDPAILGASVAC